MKIKNQTIRKILGSALVFCLGATTHLHAQGTAFTYQGRLNSAGSPANGSYDVQFTLYGTNITGLAVAGPVTNSAVGVTNGLFTTVVNFGAGVFTGPNYWLEIAVSTNGANAFSTLAPRQALTPVPYAIFANSASNLLGTLPSSQLTGTIPAGSLSGTIGATNISGTYSGPVTFNNGANTFDGTFYGQFLGTSFIGGVFSGQFIGDGGGLVNINPAHINGQVAYLNSNQVFTAQNVFAQSVGIGNPNPSPLFPLDVTANQANIRLQTTNSNNGSVLELWNTVSNQNEYLGAINFHNGVSDLGQIGYIAGNPTNDSFDSLQFRVAQTLALTIQADSRGSQVPSLIGGFWQNSMSPVSTGGNVIAGGGYWGTPNVIYSNSGGVFIGAGAGNQVGPNVGNSTIVGGSQNSLQGWNSFIGGGYYNTNSTDNGFIGGGFVNTILYNNWGAFIGAGSANTIQTFSGYSLIGSGYGNTVQSNSSYSVVSGGYLNTVQTNMPYSFIGGGLDNSVNYGFTNPPVGFNGAASVVGGMWNQANGNWSFIGGGAGYIASGIGSAVLGGNIAQYNVTNGLYSFYGGNGAKGFDSTVVGGAGNWAVGDYSFAAGYLANAIHPGTFVWADSGYPYGFSSTTSNEFSIRAQNGVHIQTDKGIHLSYGDEPIIVRDWDIFATNAPATKVGIGRWGLFMESHALTLGIPDTNNVGDSLPRYFQVAKYATNGSYTPLMWVDQSGNLSTAGSINESGGVNASYFTGDGSGLNNVNAAYLNGLTAAAFAPAGGSTNYIQNQFAVPQSASFNISGSAAVSGAVGAASLNITNNAQVSGLIVSGSGSGTGEAPSPSGLVVRRVNSTSYVSNVVVAVARTSNNGANIALVRDGTYGGFQIQYPASPGNLTIACMGIDTNGVSRNFYSGLANPGTPGTVQIYNDSQHIVHFECTFGVTYNAGQHLTHVTLSRYSASGYLDNFWSGDLTSTYNQ